MALNLSRILVLRALGLGDLLTAVPALRAVRAQYPDAHLALAMPDRYADLVALAHGADGTACVDEVIDTRGLTGPPPGPTPDLAINLHGRGPQSIDVCVATGAPSILTHAHPDRGLAGPPWMQELHEVDRWCRLTEYGGASADRRDRLIARPADVPVTRSVVVHPGAASLSRRWPPDRFARVAARLDRQGHRVVLTGVAEERGLCRAIADQAGLGADAVLAGELDLVHLAALVCDADLVVCGDTGVAHLASAYRTPSVVLFGPTPPRWWGPPSDGPHTVLWSGRTGDPHADTADPGLLDISVSDVLTAVRDRL
ncbi:glycosyltransferase family 9 protein [Rhodococcus sp. BP-316]|nr:glycosyltransferase family 9 protein [Rhodococcus sp. BP-316]